MTVAITRQDLSAADLRQAAARTQDGKVARRMLAIARVLEGCSRTEAAETCAMERPDAARLGAPLQCQRAGWPVGPTAAQRPAATPVGRAAGRDRGLGGRGC